MKSFSRTYALLRLVFPRSTLGHYLLLAIGLVALPRALSAQEIAPMRVEGPHISRTVFTNWDRIEIVFTLGWLDGYEPVFDDLRPEQMNFAPFEIDPSSGNKLLRRNQRKFRKENYVDLVYYVRHIGEKKEELIIPAQTFYYRRTDVPTGVSQNNESIKSAEFKVRYDSVLTAGADDIMDQIDFGSFHSQALTLKVAAAVGFLIFGSALLFVVFRRPVLDIGTAPTGTNAALGDDELPVTANMILTRLSEATTALLQTFKTPVNYAGLRQQTRKVCNAGTELLQLYVPNATGALTIGEFLPLIEAISEPQLRSALTELRESIHTCERYLYATESSAGDSQASLATLRKVGVIIQSLLPKLEPDTVASQTNWFNLRQQLGPSTLWTKLAKWIRSR